MKKIAAIIIFAALAVVGYVEGPDDDHAGVRLENKMTTRGLLRDRFTEQELRDIEAMEPWLYCGPRDQATAVRMKLRMLR